MKFLTSLKGRLFLIGMAVTAMSVSFVGQALATEEAADYGKVTEGASTQISAAVPIALGVVGLFVGIMIAYKLLRRIVRA